MSSKAAGSLLGKVTSTLRECFAFKPHGFQRQSQLPYSQSKMVMRPISDAAAEKAAASIHAPRDPNTLANYNAWRTQHTTANYAIDFEGKRLHGSVSLTLKKLPVSLVLVKMVDRWLCLENVI